MIVAVDGPSGVGKGTLARRLAEHFGWDYLETGALYRALAHRAIEAGTALDESRELAELAAEMDLTRLDDPALRREQVGQAASRIAADPVVRQALLEAQRRFAHHPPGGRGAVLDGRDVGTVVCPDADVKLFLTADFEARVDRRCRQLAEAGHRVDRERVAADLAERDARDRERSVAPLTPARDAHLLDTTNLDIDSTFQAAKAMVADHRA